MISRRQMNWFLAGGSVWVASSSSLWAAEFWEKKDPSAWSEEELKKLLMKSPWAKQINVSAGGSMPGGGMPGGGGPPGGGVPGGMGGGMSGGGPPGGGMGGGMPGGGGPGGPGGGMPGGAGALPKATIRWESALPILLASGKKERGTSEKDFYIVGVVDLPFAGPGGAGPRGIGPKGPSSPPANDAKGKASPLDAATAYLAFGDHSPFRAESIESGRGITRFLFPRSDHPMRKEDKNVTFEARLGPISLKTKFSLKDMVYRGQVEL